MNVTTFFAFSSFLYVFSLLTLLLLTQINIKMNMILEQKWFISRKRELSNLIPCLTKPRNGFMKHLIKKIRKFGEKNGKKKTRRWNCGQVVEDRNKRTRTWLNEKINKNSYIFQSNRTPSKASILQTILTCFKRSKQIFDLINLLSLSSESYYTTPPHPSPPPPPAKKLNARHKVSKKNLIHLIKISYKL